MKFQTIKQFDIQMKNKMQQETRNKPFLHPKQKD
jgi:hypothetical protein